MRSLLSVATLAAAVLLGLTASATAATVSYDGDVLVYTGSAAANGVSLAIADDGTGRVDLSDREALTGPADRCEQITESFLRCARPTAIRGDLGAGDDAVTAASDFALGGTVAFAGGPGNDDLQGSWKDRDELDGGPGNDTLRGYGGDDRLDGGEGDDIVLGHAGRDTVLGGAGNDKVSGDFYEAPSADVVDGGPGVDVIDEDWTDRAYDAPVTALALTLGGGADDGRSSGGEGDDVRGVERVAVNIAGTYVGTDAAEEFTVRQVGGPITMRGGGGDDVLRSGDGADTLDGGPGNDTIDGGFGDDTITGGPGRDRISADTAGGDCGPAWCKVPYGNDTIDVRDGEVDSVDCGAGTDVVEADADDVVAPNCETVRRPGAIPRPVPGAGPQPAARRLTLTVLSGALRDARGKGLRVRVGAPAAGTVRLVARRGRTIVGRASRRVTRAGSATVRVTPTKAGRRLRRGARVTVTATFAPPAGAGAQVRRATRVLR